jgi:diguanylate cyclase
MPSHESADDIGMRAELVSLADDAPPVMTTGPPGEPALAASEIEKQIRRLDVRSAGLWITASLLVLLLTAAVYAAALPQIGPSETIAISLRALVGLVLIFNAFALYQQVTMRRFRIGLLAELHRQKMVEQRKELLEKLSTVDELTELYNRRYIGEHLPLECARADRSHYPLTLLMIDLNHFKQINDQHGHAAGDTALQVFSAALRRAIRAIDVPVRLGGDEFLVCLPECTEAQVPAVTDRIRRTLARYDKLPIDFAAGWSQRAPGEAPEEVVARADAAMYREKAEHHTSNTVLAAR